MVFCFCNNAGFGYLLSFVYNICVVSITDMYVDYFQRSIIRWIICRADHWLNFFCIVYLFY